MTTKKTISSTCLPVVPFFVPSTYPSEVLLVCTQLLVSSTKKGKTLRSFTSAYFQKLYKSKHAVSKKKKTKEKHVLLIQSTRRPPTQPVPRTAPGSQYHVTCLHGQTSQILPVEDQFALFNLCSSRLCNSPICYKCIESQGFHVDKTLTLINQNIQYKMIKTMYFKWICSLITRPHYSCTV